MRSTALNTYNPLKTCLKHVKLSPCPIEISLQHKTNSLDTNVICHGILQHEACFGVVGLVAYYTFDY